MFAKINYNYETNSINYENVSEVDSTDNSSLFINNDGKGKTIGVIAYWSITNGDPLVLSVASHDEYIELCKSEMKKDLEEEYECAKFDGLLDNYIPSTYGYSKNDKGVLNFKQNGAQECWQIEYHLITI